MHKQEYYLTLVITIAISLMATAFQASADDALKTSKPPLWSFAWVTDMHMGSATPEYIAKSFRYIDEVLKPNFVLITGDNNFIEASADTTNPTETKGLRRQRFMKTFFQKHLKTPYVVIPGDDWPLEFDKVFGPKQFSFDYGGMHFILLAPDRFYHGAHYEGLSVFDKPTLDWIGQDLDRNRERPTIVVIHEPIFPPTFLDALRLRKLIDRHSNVFVALQGHLHIDLEFNSNGTTYLVGPSLGQPPSRAMKLVQVYPEGLVVRTIAHKKADDRFEMTSHLLEIEIAKPLRSQLSAPTNGKFIMGNYDAVPAHPMIEDPALEARVGELMKNAVQTLLLPKQ